MSRTARLEPAAVPPGGVEQMMVKLEEPATIVGVKLDDPSAFEVVRVIAGRNRAEGDSDMRLDIAPPNAFVIVLVKTKDDSPETRICSGDLLLDGEGAVAATAMPAQNIAPVPRQVVPAPPAAMARPGIDPDSQRDGGTKSFKVDGRGWPQGGMNEVFVLMGRGEAERMLQAINGYPITSAERPALLRRFQQALGLVR